MITQPNAHIEARPTTPLVEREPRVHLPRRSTQTPNLALTGLQLLVALLRGLVAPNAVLFGYLIEWGETLAGLGLVTAGLVALLRPLAGRYPGGTSAAVFLFGARLLERLAPLAATGAGLLGLNYFLLDGAPSPWFVPGIAFGGAIDTGLFLVAASVVLVVSQFMPWYHSQ